MAALIAHEAVHHEQAEGGAHPPAPRGMAEGTEQCHEDDEDEGEQERDEQNRDGPLGHSGSWRLGPGRVRRARLGRSSGWRRRPGPGPGRRGRRRAGSATSVGHRLRLAHVGLSCRSDGSARWRTGAGRAAPLGGQDALGGQSGPQPQPAQGANPRVMRRHPKPGWPQCRVASNSAAVTARIYVMQPQISVASGQISASTVLGGRWT